MSRRAADEFDLAVRGYHRMLFRYAYWLTHDRAVAEDLVQECFCRAWNRWDTLTDDLALKAWLFTILRREFFRWRERRRPDTEWDGAFDFATLATEGLDLGDALAVRRALDALPAGFREPLVLQILGGFSCAEIARMLDTTEAAIMTRLSRARQAMRQLMDPKSQEKAVS